MPFSRVRVDDLVDEEEEIEAAKEKGAQLFKKAQDAYTTIGHTEEVLDLFQRAEAAFAPLLVNGLPGLQPKELEMVLKGRLHQAAVLAQLQMASERRDPVRWGAVKRNVEDVLAYDFSNAHAHWLRGLALFHEPGKKHEAKEELWRAVDSAKSQGKGKEAQQWETEIERLYSNEPEEEPVSRTPAVSSSAPAAKAQEAPAMQRGFLTKQSTKDIGKKSPAPVSSPGSNGAAKPPAVVNGAHREANSEATAALRAELDTLRSRLESQAKELAEVRSQRLQLEQIQEESRQQADDAHEQRQQLQRDLQLLEGELESFISGSTKERPAHLQEQQLRAALLQIQEHSQAGRTWAEGEHQRFMDFSTEVATLREMTSRELKERQDSTQRQSGEILELTKRLDGLHGALKSLRDFVRRQAGAQDEQPDMKQLASSIAEFRALPAGVKFWVLLEDAAILRLVLIAAVCGMLLSIGVAVEAFSFLKCRFVCTGPLS